MVSRNLSFLFTVIVLFIFVSEVQSKVKFSPLFSANMMFQRGQPINIWGIANPGESVEVTFSKNSMVAKADKEGWWKVTLPALDKGENLTLTAKGENTVILKNIIMGDIWICGGQSNMHFALKSALGSKEDIKKANYPKIRHMKVGYYSTSPFLEKHVAVGLPWQECSPKTAGKFTAAGFYFARKIYEKTGVPIGLINVNRGSSLICSWMPIEGFLNAIPSRAKAYQYGVGGYTKWQLAKSIKAMKEWTVKARKGLSGGVLKDHDQKENIKLPGLSVKMLSAMEGWLPLAEIAERTKMMTNDDGIRLKSPPRIKFIRPKDKSISFPPNIACPPNGAGGWLGGGGYCMLYNGMIHPLIKYKIKGFLWYQGESNALQANGHIGYDTKMTELVNSWRNAWQDKDLPFYFVQIPNWKKEITTPKGGGVWAETQMKQLESLKIKHSGMVVTIDIGDEKDLHPKNKLDVGKRLARWALKNEYGEEGLVCSGPLYQSMKIEGSKVRITFGHTGSGLMVGSKAGSKDLDNNGKLKLFSIAGADQQWVWADAKIDGNTVIVSSSKVKAPVAVRYAFTRNPEGANLFNKEGLPASPFKTDLPVKKVK